MDDLDDELDLRYHRGIKPDVYYRCPSTESLDGALRNEMEKSSASLIPVEIVTEFVFGHASTITIPVFHQLHLDTLFQPAEYPQSITVDHALCRGIESKERLKLQRAIARSLIAAIQEVDGFKYSERHAWNKDGSAGARFKYVCTDSTQNPNRKGNIKSDKEGEIEDGENRRRRKSNSGLPTYDCGGAIHVSFSTTKDAVNVVYKHNPVHRHVESQQINGDSELPSLATGNGNTVNDSANGTKERKRKRKRSKKDQIDVDSEFHDAELDMATSPEASRTPPKKRNQSSASLKASRSSTKKSKKAKRPQSPLTSREKSQKSHVREPSPPLPQPIRGKCLRCREKGIKCNEAKPTCNQCRRGLWTCQYEIPGPKKRSKNGCLNCRSRKRKCTEERPSCAHCLRVDDDCVYADYA